MPDIEQHLPSKQSSRLMRLAWGIATALAASVLVAVSSPTANAEADIRPSDDTQAATAPIYTEEYGPSSTYSQQELDELGGHPAVLE